MKRNWQLLFTGLGAAILFAFSLPVLADVRMPKIFSDKMVLQRQMNVPVWGWADKGENITVTVQGKSYKTAADSNGKWTVKLDPSEAGGPYTMTVAGNNRLVFNDILFGDVWICSGQSNMGFVLKSADNAKTEIPAANFPNIRLATVPCTSKAEPQDDVAIRPWTECSPNSATYFSAVGYFFGKKIHQEINVPIGLINNAWGGATCEAYVNPTILAANPDFMPTLDAKRIEKQKPQYKAGYLYNGMLYPIMPYAIKGVIWYQGEANTGRAVQYRSLFKAMINNWRAEWKQGDFPFYFVQLANFLKVNDTPVESAWAELREAQNCALTLPKTGVAVIIDIGEADDIHPTNKVDVGNRLAALALAKDYGKSVPCSGPVYKNMTVEGNSVRLTFDSVGSGLTTKETENTKNAKVKMKLQGFAVAGADKKFYWADNAKIDGNSVLLSCEKVAEPKAVRYAWANNPVCNLYNKEGFPASPFRTDKWPEITRNKF